VSVNDGLVLLEITESGSVFTLGLVRSLELGDEVGEVCSINIILVRLGEDSLLDSAGIDSGEAEEGKDGDN
jgi:hypothetical protein